MARSRTNRTRRQPHRDRRARVVEQPLSEARRVRAVKRVTPRRDPYEVTRQRNKVAYSTGLLRPTQEARYELSEPAKQAVKGVAETKLKMEKKERLKCKERPKSNRSGKRTGAKKFVPWCK